MLREASLGFKVWLSVMLSKKYLDQQMDLDMTEKPPAT